MLQATRVNFLGARGIEAVLTIQGNQARLSWLLYDGHGNLVRVMASDYTLSGFQWRGVWGEVQSSLGAGRGYCANLGHSEDETGLVYMRARYYEPASGRFISEDPSRDGVNWYLYADGNPVNKVDVDGRASEWERKWYAFMTFLGIIAGALLGAGTSMVFAGAAMIKAAEAAYKSLSAQGATVLLVQGKMLMKAGVYSIVAGAALAFVVWLGLGMTEEEYQEWKDTIGDMLRFAGEIINRGWHPETWDQPF